MKTAVLCFFLVLACASARPDEDQYTNRYDNINLEEILNNRRLLVPYLNCILEQGKCTPEGKELKSHIREALETYCGKCTKRQHEGTRQVLGHLINNEGDYWDQLTKKYDPSRKYVQKYESELRVVQASG